MSGNDVASFPDGIWVVTQHLTNENRDEYSRVTTNIKSAKEHEKNNPLLQQQTNKIKTAGK